VYTVLADTLDADVVKAVGALPHRGSPHGVMARLRHGLARVGSWFDPFH
jgi:hypothetical protein